MEGEFPGSPVVRTPRFHCKGAWVRSLVGELRSRMPCDPAQKKKKKKRVPIEKKRPKVGEGQPWITGTAEGTTDLSTSGQLGVQKNQRY